MVLAYDYPILGFFWSMLIFFVWLAWFMLLFRIVIDVFRSRDLGGVAKACWILFVAFLPFLGVFVYLVARGQSLHERELGQAQAQQEAFAQYVQQVAAPTSAADELAKLAELKAAGTITEAEFAAQKARILS